MRNRQDDTVSAQISCMGVINFQDGQPFNLGRPFNLKNDGETSVVLEVNLWGMEPEQYITTRFDVGWNPEIIRSIKTTSAPNLFWGD